MVPALHVCLTDGMGNQTLKALDASPTWILKLATSDVLSHKAVRIVVYFKTS